MLNVKKQKITVCQICRSRKIKCDRGKPKCSKCVKLGIECVYDYDEPHSKVKSNINHPLPSTFDITSVRTNNYGMQSHLLPLPLPYTFNPGGVPVSPMSMLPAPPRTQSFPEISPDFSQLNYTKLTTEDLKINLKDYPKPVVMIVEDTKFFSEPFTVVGFVQKDPFLKALCGSFYGIANLEYYSKDFEGVSKLIETIGFENRGVKEISLITFLSKIIKRKTSTSTKSKPELWTPSVLFWNDFKLPNQLSSDELPPFLANILGDLEAILPDVAAISFLLMHFYDTIYPVHPYLNLSVFKSTLGNILTENSGRYIINLGRQDIRKKLIILSIFLLILKISHCSLSLTEHLQARHHFFELKLGEEQIMNGSIIVLAQKLYSLLNTMEASSEEGLIFLVYLNMYEFFNSDNENVCLLQKQMLVLNSIHDFTKFLGLHKDMNLFPHIAALKSFDDEYIVYRKRLYLGATCWRLGILLPSGYGNLNEIAEVELFIKENNSIVLDPGYDFLAKKLRFFLLLLRLNNVSNNEMNVSLKEFKKLMKSCEAAIAKDFSLACVMGSGKNKVFASEIFLMNVMGRLCLLNQSFILMVYFEDKVSLGPYEYGQYQSEFMIETFRIAMETLGLILNYLEGNYHEQIPESQSYMISQDLISAMFKCWLVLLAMNLRIEYTKKEQQAILASKSLIYQKSNSPEDADRHDLMTKLDHLLTDCTELMRYCVQLLTKKLTTKYFACYEMVCLFGYVVHLLDMDKLTDAAERFWSLMNYIPPEIITKIQLKCGIDISETTRMISKLENSNVLSNIDAEVVTTLQKIMGDIDFSFKKNTVSIPTIAENQELTDILANELDEYFTFWESSTTKLSDSLF